MEPAGGVRFSRHRGSYYRIAFECGRALRRTFTPPPASAERIRLALQCEHLLERFYPPLLGQLAGFVDGGEFNRDDFAAYYFARERSVHRRRCTLFAVAPGRTDDRQLLVGRTYDWVRGDLRWCELREIRPDAVPAMLGYSNHWIGCPDVLTSQGLLIALATLPSRPLAKPGLQWNALIDIVAATCATVDEAARALDRLPHIRAMNYLVADAHGHAAIVEAAASRVTRRDLRSDFLVATNRPVGQTEDATDRRRSDGAVQLLRSAGAKIGLDAAKAILRNHEFGICNGDHAKRSDDNWETLWSFVCKPSQSTIWIVPGRPCENEYVRFGFENGVLGGLATNA